MRYVNLEKYLWKSDSNLARAPHLLTRITWIAIEIAINQSICCVNCMPRWPRELWVDMQSLFSLGDLSVICLWLIWEKSSAGRNYLTMQGQSSPWIGREKATTFLSALTSSSSSSTAPALSLSVFLFDPELVVSRRSHPREHSHRWICFQFMERWFEMDCSRKEKKKKEKKVM